MFPQIARCGAGSERRPSYDDERLRRFSKTLSQKTWSQTVPPREGISMAPWAVSVILNRRRRHDKENIVPDLLQDIAKELRFKSYIKVSLMYVRKHEPYPCTSAMLPVFLFRLRYPLFNRIYRRKWDPSSRPFTMGHRLR